MRKINYVYKKVQAGNRELENLKEGDEITEALLDDCGEGYLTYITDLIKQTKTPNKKMPQKIIDHNSSDESPPQKWPKELPVRITKPQNSHVQTKARRHSEASAKISTLQRENEYKNFNKIKNESTKVSPISKKNEQNTQELVPQKSKKRKLEHIHNEFTLKNQQKTMQFSRNTVQNSKFKEDHFDYDKDNSKKSRVTHKSRENYYHTSQNYEDTDNEPSIEYPLKKEAKKKGQRITHQNFIDNINEYITTLEENESVNLYQSKKQSDDDRERLFRKLQKSKKLRMEEDDYDIQNLIKQNLKLTKRIKIYQQKIAELDQQISNHLAYLLDLFSQCKGREKTYKNKINYLLRGLIQAFMKIDAQQAEIATLKDLHRAYGQKVKQIQNKFDEDDILEDIREEIFKNLAPKRHSSEIRTKHKKVLESTLPKYDQDRHFW